MPFEFDLKQNFPNPFNPRSSFEFGVSSSELVTLKVFDVLGRELATVVSEVLAPGTYRRTWEAAGVPSEVYFFQVKAGSYSATKKLIILK